MTHSSPKLAALVMLSLCLGAAGTARGGAEVKLDREFLDGLVEKIPPAPFQKAGQYRGSARGFRLVAIDPKKRRLVVACEVVGEYRPPVAGALRRAITPPGQGGKTPAVTVKPTSSPAAPDSKLPVLEGNDTKGWSAFTFDVRASVNVEPGGPGGAPKLAVDVEEVKRRELEGLPGALALVLGRHFDALVTQIADGKAALLSAKVNEKIRQKIAAFSEYGVLRELTYAPDGLLLAFDVTTYKADGIAGYVFAADSPAPGTTPLYRWARVQFHDFYYTTRRDPPAGHPYYVYEQVACHVFTTPQPGTVPLNRWRGAREWFYTTAADGEGFARKGYHPEAVACFVYPNPTPGAVPLYRFTDPRGLHFYTTHPHAEFAK